MNAQEIPGDAAFCRRHFPSAPAQAQKICIFSDASSVPRSRKQHSRRFIPVFQYPSFTDSPKSFLEIPLQVC